MIVYFKYLNWALSKLDQFSQMEQMGSYKHVKFS